MKLKDYASTQPTGNCKVCALPKQVRQEAEAGLAQGVKTAVVCRWLQNEKSVAITESSVKRHRANHMKGTR